MVEKKNEKSNKTEVITLTYHRAINYGAVLQCFALQHVLIGLGYEAKVLDYESEAMHSNNAVRPSKSAKHIIKFLILLPFFHKRYKKYNAFRNFLRKNVILTEYMTNRSDAEEYLNNYANKVVVGSDQVWNPLIGDFDELFFLNGISGVSKNSYAASFGNANENNIAPYINCLKSFDNILVREQSGSSMLKKFEIDSDGVVVDPVFLIKQEEWKIISGDFTRYDYILCYFLNNDFIGDYINKVKKFGKKNKLRIVYIMNRCRIQNIVPSARFDVGPEEFLCLIQNASFVFTDSFHGTAFACIFNKQFISFQPNELGQDDRIYYLLKQLNLEQRIDNLRSNVVWERKIDFQFVNYRIDELRKQGIDCLKKIMEQ